MKRAAWFAITVLALSWSRGNAQSSGVAGRGESHEGMGFSQTTTTHHVFLAKTGGIIQVTANDPKNAQQIATVQMQLEAHYRNVYRR